MNRIAAYSSFAVASASAPPPKISNVKLHELATIMQWSRRQLRLTRFRGSIFPPESRKIRDFADEKLGALMVTATVLLPVIIAEADGMEALLDEREARMKSAPINNNPLAELEDFVTNRGGEEIDIFESYSDVIERRVDCMRVADASRPYSTSRKSSGGAMIDLKKRGEEAADDRSQATMRTWRKYLDLLEFHLPGGPGDLSVNVIDFRGLFVCKVMISYSIEKVRGRGENEWTDRYCFKSLSDMFGFSYGEAEEKMNSSEAATKALLGFEVGVSGMAGVHLQFAKTLFQDAANSALLYDATNKTVEENLDQLISQRGDLAVLRYALRDALRSFRNPPTRGSVWDAASYNLIGFTYALIVPQALSLVEKTMRDPLNSIQALKAGGQAARAEEAKRRLIAEVMDKMISEGMMAHYMDVEMKTNEPNWTLRPFDAGLRELREEAYLL